VIPRIKRPASGPQQIRMGPLGQGQRH